MEKELEIIERIVGDLAGVSLWAVVAYLVVALVGRLFVWSAAVWLAYALVSKILAHLQATHDRRPTFGDIDDRDAQIRSLRNVAAAARVESERTKHLYKLLKEKANARAGS